MNKETIIIFLSRLYYFFSFMCSLVIVEYYTREKYGNIITILYLILCGILLIKTNEISNSKKNRTNIKHINELWFLNIIRNVDYSKFKAIENILFTELDIFKFILKNGTYIEIERKNLPELTSLKKINEFDNYLYENLNIIMKNNFLENNVLIKNFNK